MIGDIVHSPVPSSGNSLEIAPNFSQLLHTSRSIYIYLYVIFPWVLLKTNPRADSYLEAKPGLKLNRQDGAMNTESQSHRREEHASLTTVLWVPLKVLLRRGS